MKLHKNIVLTSDAYEEHRQFWQGRAELIETHEPIAMLYRQGDLDDSGEQSIHFELSKGAAQKVISLVKGDPTGVFVVLSTIVALLQSRYNQQPLAVIKTPLLNAHLYDELFAEHTSIIAVVEQEASVKELLVGVRKVVSETYNYQNYPSNLAFGDQEYLLEQAKIFSCLRGLHSEGEREATDLGIYWSFDQEMGSISCDLSFSPRFYDTELVNRMPRHIETLVQAFSNLDQSVKNAALLEAEEVQEILSIGSGAVADYPLDKSVVELFEECAARFPNREAIVFGEARWTYQALNEKANQLAAFLVDEFDLGSGDLIAIILNRGDEFILSTLAALKAGVAYLPIDPEIGEDRLHFMLDQTNAKGVILRSEYLFEHTLDDRPVFAIDVQLSGLDTPSKNLLTKPSSADIAYIIYTSGSSGRPKGIKVANRSLVNLCYWHADAYAVNENARAMHFSSVGFDASVWEVWPYLLFGACVFPLESDLRLLVHKLTEFVSVNRISHTFLPSSYCEEVLAHGVLPMEHELHILAGGEGLRNVQLAGHYKLYNNYGPTEASAVCTATQLTEALVEKSIPIGRPISNGGILLLNAEGEMVPLGHQGEICITGVPVSEGYIDSAQSSRGFCPNPFKNGEMMYRSGDWGRWRKDGQLLFEGRKDHQVKIRGFRIELEEIENVIGTHPDVERALVICHESVQNDRRLVGWIQTSAEIGPLQIKSFLADKLPEYMIPAEINCEEVLPLTRNGKVDRKALAERATHVAERKQGIVAPRNEIEKQLLEIWQEVLALDAIGVTDNFFDIGGHSLKAALVLSAIYKQMSVEVDISDLFKQPTIEAIAKLIETKESVDYLPIPALPISDRYIASHAQERLWTIYQMDKLSPIYNMARHFFFHGSVNETALEAAVKAFVKRHEIARTQFTDDHGRLYQVVLPELNLTVERNDVSSSPNTEVALRTKVEAFTNQPFDLEKGPLLRVCLTKVNEKSLLFSLVMHHIISDAISLQILTEELTQTYLALCRNEDSGFEPLPIQYKDYAHWQRANLLNGSLDHHREYWHQKLGGFIPRLKLPLDRPRQASRAFKGEVFDLTIAPDLALNIKRLSSDASSSTFMVLTAALHAFLYKYTGQKEHLLGTPVAGRDHPDLNGQVGFYVNTIVLRNNVKPDERFSDLLMRVRESSLEAFDHQSYPFDRLVEELEPSRDFGRSALFDLFFMFLRDDMHLPDMGDLRLEEYDQEHDGTSKFDLIIVFRETPDELNLHAEFDSELFTAERIQKMMEHYVSMLEELVTTPNLRIQDYEFKIEPIDMHLQAADCMLKDWSICAEMATYSEIVVLDPDRQPLPVGVTGGLYVVVSEAISEKAVDLLSSRIMEWRSGEKVIRTGESGRISEDGRFIVEQLDEQFIHFDGEVIDLFAEEAKILTLDWVEDCRLGVSVANHLQTVFLVIVPSDVSEGLPLRMLETIRPKVAAAIYSMLDVRLSRSLPTDQQGRMDWSGFFSKQTVPLRAIETMVQEVAGKSGSVVVHPSVLYEALPVSFMTLPVRNVQVTASEVSNQDGPAGEDSKALIVGEELHIPADNPKTLVAGFLKTCALYPEKGIVHRSGGKEKRQTYATLLKQATHILGGLQSSGVKPGDQVILQIDDTELYFATFWAALLGGIIPVTVAVPSTYSTRDGVVNKLFNTWKLLDEPLLLTLQTTEKAMEGLTEVFPDERWVKLSIESFLEKPIPGIFHEASPEDVAFYQLSSGSTGIPKCIQEKHEGVIAHILGSCQFVGYKSSDVVLNWLPMDHVVPLLMYHVKDTFLGCEQVQLPTAEVIENPLTWLDCLEQYEVTHTWSPNFGYRLVSEEIKKQPERSWNLTSVKRFLNAGEQVTYPVVKEFLSLTESFGVAQHCMQPAYGMAELCTAITYVNDFSLQKDVMFIQKSSLARSVVVSPKESDGTVTFVNAGKVNPGVSVRIANKQGEVLKTGQLGLVQAKGPIVTKGYYKNPEANEAAFAGGGWFNTGDLGFIKKGVLTITGREKDVIIINGANFYCYEIEDVVNEVEGVQSTWSAAVSRENDASGTEELVVFFVPDSAIVSDDLTELKIMVSKAVSSSFGIAPAGVVTISETEFPKTTSGKIQRQQLKQRLIDGEFEGQLATSGTNNESFKVVPDWFFRRQWRPMHSHSVSKATDSERWLIFEDDKGFGQSIATSLGAQGKSVIKVKAGEGYSKVSDTQLTVKPDDEASFMSLSMQLEATSFLPTHVLWLWPLSLSATSAERPFDWEQACSFGVYSMTLFLQSIHAKMEEKATWGVISKQAMKTSDYEVSNPNWGGIPAWLRTLNEENDKWQCLFMDVDDIDSSTQRTVLEEMRSESVTPEVVFRKEQRFVPVLSPVNFSREQITKTPVKQNGFYLLAGGMGGIGRLLALHLLRRYDASILVVGRSALDKDPIREAALNELRNQGGNIEYMQADICNSEELKQAVETMSMLWNKSLDGAFHLASSAFSVKDQLASSTEHFTTTEALQTYRSQFEIKAQGMLSLASLQQEGNSFSLVAFSSVNSVFGGTLFSAYAAANQMMDAISLSLNQRKGMNVQVCAWSVWEDTGMSDGHPALEAARAKGYLSMNSRQGMASLDLVLSSNVEHVLIGLDKNVRTIQKQMHYALTGEQQVSVTVDFQRENSASTMQSLQKQLAKHLPDNRLVLRTNEDDYDTAENIEEQTDIEVFLLEVWRDVLNNQHMRVSTNLFSLGLNSIKVVRALGKINKEHSFVNVTHLYSYPTVRQLAEFIDSQTESETDAGKHGEAFEEFQL